MSSGRIAESEKGLNSSLAAGGWRYMAKKGRANMLARAVLKYFTLSVPRALLFLQSFAIP